MLTKADIAQLPKVALHDHLDGGLRPATIIELGLELGLELPTTNPDELADWFYESCTGGDLTSYLKTFELTVAVMQSAKNLSRVAKEFALDLASERVIYAEVRWAPEQHTKGGLSLHEAVTAVQEGLESAIEEVAAQGGLLKTGQILCAMRQSGNSLEIAQLALDHRESGVVGFDLAGPEAGFLPSMHEPALELLAKNNFAVTLHAGEEGALDSIADAVFQRALRLGHATRLVDDLQITVKDEAELEVSLGYLAEWVKDRGVTLECCVSSNLQTGASPLGEGIYNHPFDLFYQLGLRVTVNTDNRLMSRTTLTNELTLLSEAFDYNIDDLATFQLNAVSGAFLPLDERMELMELILEGHGQERL